MVPPGRHERVAVRGRHGDDAADRVRSVQRGRRSAKDLDPVHDRGIHGEPARVREIADAVLLRQRHAVELERDAIAADPADRHATAAKPRRCEIRLDRRLVARDVREVLRLLERETLGGEHGDLGGNGV